MLTHVVLVTGLHERYSELLCLPPVIIFVVISLAGSYILLAMHCAVLFRFCVQSVVTEDENVLGTRVCVVLLYSRMILITTLCCVYVCHPVLGMLMLSFQVDLSSSDDRKQTVEYAHK